MIESRAIGDLFCVDPGLNSPGVALFRGGRLMGADRIRVDKDWASLDRLVRARRVASACIRWLMVYEAEPRTVVIEHPQWYDSRKGKTKVDPNDLAGLVAVAAEVDGQLSMAMAARDVVVETVTYLPHEWSDGVPKSTTGPAWESPRGRRAAFNLTQDERDICPAQNDAIDAVCLGLKFLDRFDPVRIYPGAV